MKTKSKNRNKLISWLFHLSSLIIVLFFSFRLIAVNSIGIDYQSTEEKEEFNKENSTVYTIDESSSDLLVRLYKAGLGSMFADNHIIEAKDINGTINFNETITNDFKVSVIVKSGSLVADPDDKRKEYDLEPIDDDDRNEITGTMKGETQLDAEMYPEIKFSSSNIEHRGKNTYSVTGKFTLHGVTNTITFPVRIKTSDDKLFANGKFAFRQSSYNIEPYSTALGTVQNKDKALLIFDITAVKKESK